MAEYAEIKKLEVDELLELIHKRYDLQIERVIKENKVLLVYKELFEEGITDKNLLEKHIELWKEVKVLERKWDTILGGIHMAKKKRNRIRFRNNTKKGSYGGTL